MAQDTLSPGTMATDTSLGTESWEGTENLAKLHDVAYAISELDSSAAFTASEDYSVRLVKGGTISGSDLATGTLLPSSETYKSFGGNSELWGLSWTPADINASDFGAVYSARLDASPNTASYYLKATNFGFSIPSTATINGIEVEVERHINISLGSDTWVYVNHIRITVYYTPAPQTITGVQSITGIQSITL